MTPDPPSTGRSFTIGDAVSYGWNAYWQFAGPMVLIAVVILAVNVVLGVIAQATDSLGALIVLQVLGFVVGIIVTMGLIRAALAVTEGRTPNVNMLLETDGFGPYLIASILVGLGVLAGLILLIVPGIILAIVWHFFGYVIVQEPTMRATDAMRRSAEITEGYRWQLLGLGLVLFLINIVGALACGVGLIFTYGITAISVAWTYKTLSGQPIAPIGR